MSSKKSSIDQNLIRDLAALLTETDLTEIEVEQDDLRIRVARVIQSQPLNIAAPPAPSHPHVEETKPEKDPPAPETEDLTKHPGVVPSPMVGTAYMSSSPGSAAFVKIGDNVQSGQTIMIVEAMKTMNQIAAPRSGKVIAIFVENAQPVEFGEPLMVIE
jgi:acetyl-CoA carboxylase biotin carboxyl carrier protein